MISEEQIIAVGVVNTPKELSRNIGYYDKGLIYRLIRDIDFVTAINMCLNYKISNNTLLGYRKDDKALFQKTGVPLYVDKNCIFYLLDIKHPAKSYKFITTDRRKVWRYVKSKQFLKNKKSKKSQNLQERFL